MMNSLLRDSIKVVLPLMTITVFVYLPNSRARAQQELTRADVDQMIEELSNWGRWGKNDQLGALNLITPEKRKQAAALVKKGISISLARLAEEEKTADNPNPFEQRMLPTVDVKWGQWSVDNFSVNYHGYSHTHMDALCHLSYRGKIYNGYSKDQITSVGARQLSVHSIKNGIVTRGILIDIPWLRGQKYLDPGTAIYPEELEVFENRAGIHISSGDVVFLRTGRWARRDEVGPWNPEDGIAGLHVSCAKWLKRRDIAMLGSDAASDVIPSKVSGITHPVHLLMLYAMGVHLFDNCDLEEVSKVAAKEKCWEFLLTTAPIPVRGGTGSPLNPIATF